MVPKLFQNKAWKFSDALDTTQALLLCQLVIQPIGWPVNKEKNYAIDGRARLSQSVFKYRKVLQSSSELYCFICGLLLAAIYRRMIFLLALYYSVNNPLPVQLLSSYCWQTPWNCSVCDYCTQTAPVQTLHYRVDGMPTIGHSLAPRRALASSRGPSLSRSLFLTAH